MANGALNGKRIAALFTDGVEQVEFTEPAKALREAGAEVVVVSIEPGKIKGWNHTEWGDEFDVDLTLDEAKPDDFNGLLIPGGVMNPDKLRMDHRAVAFVKQMARAGKPIAAICHGPWLLVEADVVRGRTVTSYPSLKTDIINAGGFWVNTDVSTDEGIVTSRNPDDIPAFNAKMLEEFDEGKHQRTFETDQVIEASEESFPASDPPSWTGTT